MKKIKFLLAGGVVLGLFYSFTFLSSLFNPEKDKLLIEIMAYVLEKAH